MEESKEEVTPTTQQDPAAQFEAALKQFNVFTENGALSNASTGSALVNYFAKAGTYRNREQADVDKDLTSLWADSPLVTLRIVFYLRTVTRKLKGLLITEKVQKGQGSRDEFRKSLKWIVVNHPNVAYENLWLVPVVGCWKDLWHPDLIPAMDRNKVYELVKRGMEDSYNVGLVAKYLPRIKSGGKLKTDNKKLVNGWAKGLAKYLKWTEIQYRKFKSSGQYTAHQFQRDMCAGFWDKLSFNTIPGKALFSLVSKKGKDGKTALERHGQQDRYVTWLSKQPTAKFTGYVYELFHEAKAGKSLSLAQQMTFNKQFDGLIELAKKDEGGIKGNVWCALDTSGSMGSIVVGKISAFDICISLGIFFATLNQGPFKDHVIMFDAASYSKKIEGTFTDKVIQITSEKTAWGSTNFESVITHICDLKKSHPEIPVTDFPETLIVVSDMQFNPVGGNEQTNYQNAMKLLADVGLPKMKIIWWFVTGRGTDFPSTIADEGVTMIGGFDGSVVSLVLGGETTVVDKKTGKVRQLNAYENMLKALDQEVLLQLKVPK